MSTVIWKTVPILLILCFLFGAPAQADGAWTFYTAENSGLVSDAVSAVAADRDGSVWVAYRDRGGEISRFDGDSWRTFTTADGLPGGAIESLASGGGTVWAVAGSRLCRFSNGRWESSFFQNSGYFAGGNVAVDPEGNLWAAGRVSSTGKSTLSRFDGAEWTTWCIAGPGKVAGFGRSGEVWVRVGQASGRDVVCRYDGARWTRYNHDRLQRTEFIAEDADGMVWSAGPMGVAGFNGTAWSTSCSCRFAGQAVAADPRGRVWFVGADALIRFDGGASLPEYLNSPGKYDRITASPDGSLLFFQSDTANGLARYTPDPPPGVLRATGQPARTFPSAVPAFRKGGDSDDWFPLHTGDIWIYRRRLTNRYGDEFTDRVMLTVVDTVTVDGALHRVFLDGRSLRNDGEGRVWSDGDVVYDFRPCGVADCGQEPIGSLRWETTLSVPAGTFGGFTFRRNDWFDALTTDTHTIAPPVGMVATGYGNDQGDFEFLDLEYARVGGREYGLESGVSAEPASAPRTFTVHPPSPNPFNPSTAIRFDLAEASRVRLTVYSAAGQKVATLCNSALSPGPHSFSWNAGRNAAGLYLFLIEAGPHRQAGKLMLVK